MKQQDSNARGQDIADHIHVTHVPTQRAGSPSRVQRPATVDIWDATTGLPMRTRRKDATHRPDTMSWIMHHDHTTPHQAPYPLDEQDVNGAAANRRTTDHFGERPKSSDVSFNRSRRVMGRGEDDASAGTPHVTFAASGKENTGKHTPVIMPQSKGERMKQRLVG